MTRQYLLTVNGKTSTVTTEPHQSLLDTLRETLGLTGSKKGCDEGECASCTVLLDGAPVNACLVLVGDAVGKSIVTIEGVAGSEGPHPLQRAFVELGGVQCGYCTPGMIVSSCALLREQPDPDRRGNQVLPGRQRLPVHWLQQDHRGRPLGGRDHACGRCSRAGAENGMITVDTKTEQGLIGTSPPRLDAWEKVTGKVLYAGDMTMPGMLHARILWSAHAHANIRSIDTTAARALPGVHAVLTHEDVPGSNRYGVAVLDQRVLAQDKVRSFADAVAIVAADTEEIAREAVERIVVEYEPLPGVFTIEDALAPNAPRVNDADNLFQHTQVRKGNIAEGFAQADLIVEHTYRTQSMDHLPMEPEAGLAYVDSMGVLNILTATQYPFRDRRQIAPNVGLPMNKVRVVMAPVGGGFGRKDDITTEIHAGLLALKTGRPVRLVYTREESLFALTKRHPFTIHYKSGARADGRLTAVEASIYGDSGPYLSLGMYVIKKAGIHATGPYYVPNVKVDTYTVTTNNLIGGAMRGFGVLQIAVAHESQMDMLARGLGLSPVEFRLINCLKPGLTTATGQVVNEGTGIGATLTRIRDYMTQHGMEWSR